MEKLIPNKSIYFKIKKHYNSEEEKIKNAEDISKELNEINASYLIAYCIDTHPWHIADSFEDPVMFVNENVVKKIGEPEYKIEKIIRKSFYKNNEKHSNILGIYRFLYYSNTEESRPVNEISYFFETPYGFCRLHKWYKSGVRCSHIFNYTETKKFREIVKELHRLDYYVEPSDIFRAKNYLDVLNKNGYYNPLNKGLVKTSA